jgi:hypothetical protein
MISRARGRASWAGAGDALHHIPGKQKDRHRGYANGSEFTGSGFLSGHGSAGTLLAEPQRWPLIPVPLNLDQ